MRKPNKREIRSAAAAAALICLSELCNIIYQSGRVPEMFCPSLFLLRSGIYLGFVCAWGSSVRRRVVSGPARRDLSAAVVLLFFLIAAVTVRGHFLNGLEKAQLLCLYCCCISVLLVCPAGTAAVVCCGEERIRRLSVLARAAFILPLAVIAAVLTNSEHQQIFAFSGGSAGVSCGPLYPAVFWCTVCETGILFILIVSRTRTLGIRGRDRYTFLIGVFATLCCSTCMVTVPDGFSHPENLYAMTVLSVIAVFEMCIRIGLIPSNMYYEEMLEASTIGVQITDNDYHVIYSSGNARIISSETMSMAEKKPVDMGTEWLCSAPVQGGHVLWMEDVSGIKTLMKQLREGSRALAENNDLLKAEVDLKARQARADEKLRLYEKITGDVADSLEKMDEMLEINIREEDMRRKLAEVCVIGAYIKRRGNLVLLGEDSSRLQAKELELSLTETVSNLRLCGVMCSLLCRCEGTVGTDQTMALYDLMEQIIEAALPTLTAFLCDLFIRDGGIYVRMCLSCDVDALAADMEAGGISAEVHKTDTDVRVVLRSQEGGVKQ